MRVNSLRLFILSTIALLMITPWLAWSAVQAVREMRNTPILWIPADNAERQQYEWFRTRFQVRDAVVISWPGCTVDDIRLQQLADEIKAPSIKAAGASGREELFQQTFDEVSTGYGALRAMMRQPLELSRAEAIKRLGGVLVGADGQTSCAVVSLTEYGVDRPAASVQLITDTLRRRLGIDPEDAYLVGPPVDGVAIDGLSAAAMQYYLVPSGLLVLLLARICLRRWRITLVVIAVAAFGELFVFSLVWLTGATMNAVLIVMAPLVFVLTVSAGVHLVNYFSDRVRRRGSEGAVAEALRAGWVPCSLAAVTTAIGLLSLVVSEMEPIRQFGALSAVGVLTVTGLLFLLLPEPLRRWGARASEPAVARPYGAGAAGESHVWRHLAEWIGRHATGLAAGSLLLLVVMAIGLARVRTSVNVLSLLGPSSRTTRDYRWLETRLAPMIPVEVVLRIPAGQPVDWLELMALLRELEFEMESIELLGGTMSAASFVPTIPRGAGFRATVERTVMRKKIESQLDAFEENRYLYRSGEFRALRLTTRAPATQDVDYGSLLAELRERVEPVLDGYRREKSLEIGAIYTGITPLIHVAQQTLLADLIRSFIAALLLVAVVIILVLRSVPAGLVAMLPNVFPAIVLFGGMGWCGIAVDIGSMMTASVALGIAIDGTLHFLIWFRREASRTVAPAEAVARTYRHCGTAMWQTALICGLGLLVFGLSDFVPMRRFAWMIFLLLLLALLGDLVLLPALLMGPLRKVFMRGVATPPIGDFK